MRSFLMNNANMYKHGIDFCIENRRGKTDSDDMPVNAGIAFGSKWVWYHIGYLFNC